MKQKEMIIKHISDSLQDSLELGTAKNGIIKVYTDFNKPEITRKKIDNAIEALEYAKQQKEEKTKMETK